LVTCKQNNNTFEEEPMDASVRAENPAYAIEATSAVSWASIAAGAAAAAALSLALMGLGAGLGLSSISPWAGSGISASTFKNAAGIYLVVVAVMSSAIGGYLAARLRTKWVGLHTNEVFFRDTAHGFIAWAFATLVSASVLAAATTSIVGATAAGVATTAGQAAQAVNPAQVYVDRLFRTETGATPPPPAGGQAQNADAVRSQVTRLWASTIGASGDLAPLDRAYVARVVSQQTGISEADAERRVSDVIFHAKAAADEARKAAAKMAFWMTAALFFGAFAASLAAVEGGQARDGTWNDRRLALRPW
jgi:hypothetical protein